MFPTLHVSNNTLGSLYEIVSNSHISMNHGIPCQWHTILSLQSVHSTKSEALQMQYYMYIIYWKWIIELKTNMLHEFPIQCLILIILWQVLSAKRIVSITQTDFKMTVTNKSHPCRSFPHVINNYLQLRLLVCKFIPFNGTQTNIWKIFLYVNQLFSSFCIHLNLQKINRYILQVSICSILPHN